MNSPCGISFARQTDGATVEQNAHSLISPVRFSQIERGFFVELINAWHAD